MEILQHNEAFAVVNDKLTFRCVKGILKIDGLFYLAEWEDRRNLPSDITQMRIVHQIKIDDRGPLIKNSWTIITPESYHYIKKPDLQALSANSSLESIISREIETCETLKLYPHPNISIYFGCTELRGRVSGLCFKKYQQTLLERVNPSGLNKTMFLHSEDRRLNVTSHFKLAADGLLRGIKHLHSLNIIHNDINPANILLDENDTFVLADFDSCRRPGEPLSTTKRTYGWHDPRVKAATETNDLNAFSELMIWLFGTSDDLYLFS